MTSLLKTAKLADHAALADVLRRRVLEGTGETSPVLRPTLAASATGGPPAPPPYDELAQLPDKFATDLETGGVAEQS
jgi:hypothetical protein